MKDREIRFSVIIPVYNVEKYIQKCLDSVLGQTEPNFEVVLVDDGSTDASGTICDEYGKKDKRIQVIHKKNGGPMSACMTGIEAACADYVVFVDSDDWIAGKMFEQMWQMVERCHPDMVSCNFTKAGAKTKQRWKQFFSAGYYDENAIKKQMYPVLLNAGDFQERGINISRWGKMIKKDRIIHNLKYCDSSISFSEDLNLIFPVLLDCQSIVILDSEESDYSYRMNPESISNSFHSTMYEQICRVYPNLIQACADKEKKQFEKQIKADYVAAIVQTYKNELMNPAGFKKIVVNIGRYAKDDFFQTALKDIEWKRYSRKLNVLIIWIMWHWNWFTRILGTGILYQLKLIKIRRCSIQRGRTWII